MTRARFSAKILGLCLVAVLGMTALISSSAQAKWLVGSGTLSGTKEVKAKAHTEFVLSVPSKRLEKLCTEVRTAAGSFISSTGLTFMLGTLEFTNCQTLVDFTLQPFCKPKEPIIARGKGEVFLHKGEEYILLVGDEETGPGTGVFRFARIDLPDTCALPDTNVSGSLVLECLNSSLSTSGNCLEHTISHLVREAPTGPENLFQFPHGLLYGVNAATVSGIGNAELSSGEAWSAHV